LPRNERKLFSTTWTGFDDIFLAPGLIWSKFGVHHVADCITG
jgi:hypothetical protein